MRGNASFQTGRRTYCTVPVVCVPYHMYIPIQYSPPGPLSPLKRMYPYSRPPAGQSYVCRRPANQQTCGRRPRMCMYVRQWLAGDVI